MGYNYGASVQALFIEVPSTYCKPPAKKRDDYEFCTENPTE
jgi:hypothetical protein